MYFYQNLGSTTSLRSHLLYSPLPFFFKYCELENSQPFFFQGLLSQYTYRKVHFLHYLLSTIGDHPSLPIWLASQMHEISNHYHHRNQISIFLALLQYKMIEWCHSQWGETLPVSQPCSSYLTLGFSSSYPSKRWTEEVILRVLFC